MSDIQCAHCKLDTGGNHEWDCPLHPRNQPIITFTGGSTQYIHIECPDCKIKDDELQLLRSRLAIAEETLKEIEEDSKTGTVSAQTFHEALNYLRSINTIANAALKKIEEGE